jgi:hypothetical protein
MAETPFRRRPEPSPIARLYGSAALLESDPPDLNENHPTEKPEFITIPEWSRRVGCAADSGYGAARRNQIPGLFRIGRLMRVNWPAFVEATTRLGSEGTHDKHPDAL